MACLIITLPAEILLAIVSELEPSRFCRRSPRYTLDKVDWKRYADLASLARTCKSLQRIAQLRLFRCLPLYYSNIAELTCTLIKQPHLAGAVQEISIGNLWQTHHNRFKWGIREEDFTLLDRNLDVYCKKEPKPPVERIQPAAHHPNWGFVDVTGGLAAVAIAQTTNIQRLVINWTDCAIPKSFTPPELPRLTEFYYMHSDNHFDFQDNYILNIIFAAAPALKKFHVHVFNSLPPNIPHNSVTEATFTRSSLSYASFKTIIEGFPHLQKFTYECISMSRSDGPAAGPREIADLLHRRRDTVTHLSLNFRYLSQHLADEEYVKIIGPMHALEPLVLSLQLFKNLETTTAALLKYLPKSIRSLGMLCIAIMPELETIAKALRAQFPDLKIHFEDEQRKSLSFS